MIDGRDPDRRSADLDRILNIQVERYDRKDSAVAWIAGGLLAFVVVASTVAAFAGMRDDVRTTLDLINNIQPCRP